MWLKHLILHLCPKLNVLSKRYFSQDILSRLVEKTNQLYVLTLVECHFATTTFDHWMFKGAYDVFTLVINFLNSDWQPKHVIIGCRDV
jgi:hypothetical protein